MFTRIIFILFVLIMIGLGLFFIIYGIQGGIIKKRILINAWRQDYSTGRDAVVRGWFYIAVGLLFIIVLVATVIDILKR
jgi:hypothetical protein